MKNLNTVKCEKEWELLKAFILNNIIDGPEAIKELIYKLPFRYLTQKKGERKRRILFKAWFCCYKDDICAGVLIRYNSNDRYLEPIIVVGNKKMKGSIILGRALNSIYENINKIISKKNYYCLMQVTHKGIMKGLLNKGFKLKGIIYPGYDSVSKKRIATYILDK